MTLLLDVQSLPSTPQSTSTRYCWGGAGQGCPLHKAHFEREALDAMSFEEAIVHRRACILHFFGQASHLQSRGVLAILRPLPSPRLSLLNEPESR